MARWSLPAHAVWLFGSAARGDGHAGSDVGLLVVRDDDVDEDDPRWERQLSELMEAVRAWTGNPGEIVEHERAGLHTSAASGDALVDDLVRDAVVVVGPSPALVFSTVGAA